MKQGLQFLGILTLLIGSFLYSEKVDTVAKLNDSLLLEIKEKSNNYKIDIINPVITNDTIIPGLNGKEVDINKSYNEMRQVGYFNEKLLVYNSLQVKDKLSKNKDKYIISGNPAKKEIGLIFKVKNNSNINKIIGLLDKHNLKATFYIDSKFLKNNYNLVLRLINKGYTIGNLSKNENYNHSDFTWMKTVIINAGKQKHNYCYTEKENNKILKRCLDSKSYTILPTKIINERPLSNIKSSLKKGSIISLEVNASLNNEIENIINYITNKGYKITSLEELLKE